LYFIKWELLFKNCEGVSGINPCRQLYKIIRFLILHHLIWIVIIIGEYRQDSVWFCKFRLEFFWLCIIQHMLILHFIVYNIRCVMFLTDGSCVICMQMEEVCFLLLFICIFSEDCIIPVMHNLENSYGLLELLFSRSWFRLLLLDMYSLGVVFCPKWIVIEIWLLITKWNFIHNF